MHPEFICVKIKPRYIERKNSTYMNRSTYKKVGIASLIMMASIFLSRVIGVFREMVIAGVGGANAAVDAYQYAFAVPEILNHVVASGFLSVTFIPIFSGYLIRNAEEEGWKVFSIILNCFGSLLIVIIVIAEIFTPELVSIFTPGISNPGIRADTIRMTRIIIPAQFFFFTGGMFMAVQFAKERFFIPALAPLVYNLGIISGGLILGSTFGMDGFSWGVLGGAFVGNFAIQLYGARKCGMTYSLTFNFRHPDLKKYVLLTLPLVIGLTMTFSTEIFMRFFGSFLPDGGTASLNYALRIMLILVAIFGQAAGVASFPFMAKLAAENRIQEMNDLLNTTLKYLSLVIPFSVLLMVLRHETVLMLFQRGEFDAQATRITANSLLFLLTGAFAFAAQTVVVRGYYAIQNTLLPAIFGTIAVLISIPVYYIGMMRWGIIGVAAALSFSSILQVLLLYAVWNRKTTNKEGISVYTFYLKILLISLFIGGSLTWFKETFLYTINTMTFSGCLIVSVISGILFLFLLMAAGYVFRIKEISELPGKILHISS